MVDGTGRYQMEGKMPTEIIFSVHLILGYAVWLL